jgi:hypothetical protein
MSDTPRMQSALLDHPDAGFAKIWQVGCEIERELNTAQERIKRLEEAGDGLSIAMRDDWSEYVDWIDKTTDAINQWLKAKEANP